jgi:hypothetical protein
VRKLCIVSQISTKMGCRKAVAFIKCNVLKTVLHTYLYICKWRSQVSMALAVYEFAGE